MLTNIETKISEIVITVKVRFIRFILTVGDAIAKSGLRVTLIVSAFQIIFTTTMNR